MRAAWVAALLAMAPAQAWATTGLQWQVDGPLRYEIDAQLQLPQLMMLRAQRNDEARVSEVRLSVVTTCTPSEVLGKRGWELSCTLDDIAIALAPHDLDRAPAERILEDWDGMLTGATVEIVLWSDGRVRSVDLEDVTLRDQNRQTNNIVETQRFLLARAFAALDLQLPKKGDDKGRKVWTQRESLVLGLPTSMGTMGSAVIDHAITATEGTVVEITTRGRGTVASGETVSVGGEERPADFFEMTLEGTASFDTEAGAMIARDYATRGTPTASSLTSAGAEGYPWVQVVTLRRLLPDAEVTLGPNRLVEREDAPRAIQGLMGN